MNSQTVADPGFPVGRHGPIGGPQSAQSAWPRNPIFTLLMNSQTVADPGFPVGRHGPIGGHGPLMWVFFWQKCKQKERIGSLGGHVPGTPSPRSSDGQR